MKKATAKKKNKPKEQKSFDSTITYFTRKPNQYFLTRDEIHGLFERYITQFNGNVVTKVNVSILEAKGQNTIKTDWSHASARLTENGMVLTYLTEVAC